MVTFTDIYNSRYDSMRQYIGCMRRGNVSHERLVLDSSIALSVLTVVHLSSFKLGYDVLTLTSLLGIYFSVINIVIASYSINKLLREQEIADEIETDGDQNDSDQVDSDQVDGHQTDSDQVGGHQTDNDQADGDQDDDMPALVTLSPTTDYSDMPALVPLSPTTDYSDMPPLESYNVTRAADSPSIVVGLSKQEQEDKVYAQLLQVVEETNQRNEIRVRTAANSPLPQSPISPIEKVEGTPYRRVTRSTVSRQAVD